MTDFIQADRPYRVLVKCPQCDGIEFLRVGLVARLDRTRAGAHLGLKVKADTVDHLCEQVSIDDVLAEDQGDELDLEGVDE